ncbi:MAG: endonuclease III [Candidatus Parcubacteria bacterium]|nr:endonuclease III [Candidatus Parcubacteria bacterium]
MKKQEKAEHIVKDLKKLFPDAKMMLRYRNHWELLVAVELSAQCTDKKVNEITPALFKKYPTLADYVNAKPLEFEKYIYQSGFYKNKTKNILAAAKLVSEKFGGKLPKTMKEMLTIPGVARKTANILLGVAYGVVEGIAVDTHVKRLTKLWGLTEESSPEKIEKDLMKILQKEEWQNFTYRVIEYGRKYCTARTKDHSVCPLGKYENK